MEKITAPYNFVPLNEKVVTPYWGPSISHDKPFLDSQSGLLEIEMTAHSPIFVRDGEISKNDKDGKVIPSPKFNQFGGSYFIPGTSIKGMLRNFIETMTFGRMDDKVNDVKYSVRDFTKGAKDAKIYDPSEISKQSHCGWLRFEGGKYFLTPCSRPGRISHKELDKISGHLKISEYYQQGANLKNDKDKSAFYKDYKFQFEKKNILFSHSKSEPGIGREIYELNSNGTLKGTIVLTGQPGPRVENKNQGKQYEFIFFDYQKPEIPLANGEDEKPHEVIRNFFHSYYDHDNGQQGEDWKWRKKQLLKGVKIPVFYRLKDHKKEVSTNNLLDMGLTLVYKTVYNYSVKESILNYQKSQPHQTPDFADCLFGYIKKINTTNFESLKGRIMISHAFANSGAKVLAPRVDVLGGPKASYYPNYIHQELKDGNGTISGNYFTFKDKTGRIRGWKKYPVRNSGVISNPAPVIKGKVNEDVATKFTPLDEGAKFTFQIAYHNLRKEELGALLSALTFHGNLGFYHSIGMAKPLGFGKVSFSIKNDDLVEREALLKEFESYMDYELSNLNTNWLDSPQVKELFAMSKPSEKGDNSLSYQKMDMENRINDFNQAKKDKKALLDYSVITGPVNIQSKANIQEMEKAKTFHSNQAAYFYSLRNHANNDPMVPFKLLSESQIKTTVESKKEELIQKLKDFQLRLKEERAKQAALKIQELDQARLEGKLNNPINLGSVKLNSRAFEALEKGMKVFQVKFKDGPLTDETDIKILSGKLKEIFTVIPDKEKTKWKDSNWEGNHYFKKIVKWLGEELTKKTLLDK